MSTILKFTRRAGLLTAAAAVLLVPAVPASADPTPSPTTAKTRDADLLKIPTMTPAVLALMKKQAGLQRVAEDISAQASHPANTGLSGLILDPRRNTVRLFWHGGLPDGVRDEIAVARGRGITVETHSAPYTKKELVREVARMSARPLSSGSPAGRSMRLAPNPDGSGINAVVSGLPPGVTSADAKQMVPALSSAYPVTVRTGAAPAPKFRWVDSTPYWGGAFIRHPLSANLEAECTDAFGVTGNNGASTYMLTAAHCGTGTWKTGAVETDAGVIENTIGSTFTAGRSTGIDAQLLLPPDGITDGGSVYVGDSIADDGGLGSNTGIPVTGLGANFAGSLVCTDGAPSGTICNIQILLTDVTITVSPENGVSTITHLVEATKMPDSTGIQAAVGNGDSGGPVFAIFGDGTAGARGIISAGVGDAPCAGVPASDSRSCSPTVYYADIDNAMSTLGVHLNTDG